MNYTFEASTLDTLLTAKALSKNGKSKISEIVLARLKKRLTNFSIKSIQQLTQLERRFYEEQNLPY